MFEEQISDKQSAKSKHGVYNLKICAYCGKQGGKHWAEHGKTKHEGNKIVWDGKSELIGDPWCENWREVIDGATAKNIHSSYNKKGFKAGNKLQKKRDARSQASVSDLASDTVYNESQFAPEEEIQNGRAVQIQIQEEVQNNFVVPQPLLPRTNLQSKSATSSMLGKRKAHKLDEPSEEEIKSSCDKVQAMFPPSDQPNFVPPSLLEQTIYVSQGMRDQEAIQKLRVLEKSTDIAQVQVLELIKLTSMFSQATVSAFIERNKGDLLHIKDLLIQAQDDTNLLSSDEIASLAFASVLFGGPAWTSLPKMFSSLDQSKLEDVLSLLDPLLVAKFNQNLAQWICTSWRYLEEQTLSLLRYLKEQHLEDSLVADTATISRMVQVQACDVKSYLTVVEGFSRSTSFKLMKDALKASAPQWKSEQKLSFEQFCSLVGFLIKNKNSFLIKANEEDLAELPLGQWMERLTTLQNASLICDVSSIQHRLIQLCEEYGPLLKNHAIDLCLSGDVRYKNTLHEVPNPPNVLQFANAQYAAFALRDRQRQLWCIPSGQGKSRVLATTALILLLANSTTKVHFVFDSRHLLERDKRDFNAWLVLHNLLSVVEYHVGLDFVCQLGDVILIDEADQIILSQPVKFLEKIQHLKCICLTATPDNDDNRGIERAVLKHMGFSLFNGQPDSIPVSSSDLSRSLGTLMVPLGVELVSYIQKRLKEYTVLLYCSLEFQQLLVAAKVPFLLMKDGAEISDKFLREELDNRGPDGSYTLIVASSSFGMRGFDYRSHKGITLIIAASFAHQRQAMQGVARVGRFDDPCQRYIVEGVALINKEQELEYRASLFKFMASHQKYKVVANIPKEEKKKQPAAATTTATSTTSGATKPKRTYNKKNKSNQSAITIAPIQQQTKPQTISGIPATNLNKRQTKIVGAGIAKQAKDKKEAEEKQEITYSQLL